MRRCDETLLASTACIHLDTPNTGTMSLAHVHPARVVSHEAHIVVGINRLQTPSLLSITPRLQAIPRPVCTGEDVRGPSN